MAGAWTPPRAATPLSPANAVSTALHSSPRVTRWVGQELGGSGVCARLWASLALPLTPSGLPPR